MKQRDFNQSYTELELDYIAFPLGGIGAGMICLQGNGGFGGFSLRNAPDVHSEPCVFASLCVKGATPVARVLEGQVPKRKVYGAFSGDAGNGLGGRSYGLPRFRNCSFTARFPFAHLDLSDSDIPLEVGIDGWSPFSPGDADASSLPFAAVEYTFCNTSDSPVEAVYYFSAFNFMKLDENASVQRTHGGFLFLQPGSEDAPWKEGACCISAQVLNHSNEDNRTDAVNVDLAWFRGGWFDPLTQQWNAISRGESMEKSYPDGGTSAGATLSLPLFLLPGEEKTVRLSFCWYVPKTNLRLGDDPLPAETQEAEDPASSSCCSCGCKRKQPPSQETYSPWYSARFSSAEDVRTYVDSRYAALKEASLRFRDAFYDTTLPPEIVEAVGANLSILKSPTVLRQTDGRLWGWEGCCDCNGCCHGSCTHVWNYAQSLCHLFPALERSLRGAEFFESQNAEGHQNFRIPLPIRKADHNFYAASDGQLGGVMKVWREYRISGDLSWLRDIWPKVRQSLDYCIRTWDKERQGVLTQPHHNTYDIEFWGADGMCSSFYLGALKAATLIAEELGENVPEYDALYRKGRAYLETQLFNGEYFFQKVTRVGADEISPGEDLPPEARALLDTEGPKYQYGIGCISDGVLGAWLALQCDVGEILDPAKVKSHLSSVYRYNYRENMFGHANPQRPGYAIGDEGGLLLCTWPRGGKPSLPFVYSDEVWTGIEYQAASHMIAMGLVEEGLQIVRTLRKRYDGSVRNPFDEYECGHFYARAMASYALLEAYSGVRYDAPSRTLYIHPAVPGDFRSFLCVEDGYATVGLYHGQPFIDVKEGHIHVDRIVCDV